MTGRKNVFDEVRAAARQRRSVFGLQRPGRAAVTAAALMRGHQIEPLLQREGSSDASFRARYAWLFALTTPGFAR